jgi:putative endonuclease
VAQRTRIYFLKGEMYGTDQGYDGQDEMCRVQKHHASYEPQQEESQREIGIEQILQVVPHKYQTHREQISLGVWECRIMVVQRSPTQPFAKSWAIPTKSLNVRFMHYVYILRSGKDQKLYIGRSSDLKRRFEEHAQGKVDATKHRRPLQLMYYEAYDKRELAIERESKLKKFGSAYHGLVKRLQ